jgi:hypothetical protein
MDGLLWFNRIGIGRGCLTLVTSFLRLMFHVFRSKILDRGANERLHVHIKTLLVHTHLQEVPSGSSFYSLDKININNFINNHVYSRIQHYLSRSTCSYCRCNRQYVVGLSLSIRIIRWRSCGGVHVLP